MKNLFEAIVFEAWFQLHGGHHADRGSMLGCPVCKPFEVFIPAGFFTCDVCGYSPDDENGHEAWCSKKTAPGLDWHKGQCADCQQETEVATVNGIARCIACLNDAAHK